ncbi:hypothetical protein M5K25_012501 [Dendrobium thyrsiflorum]|uniref:Uncharacterized protein n=1 Tax=Dendrobium thyrsiflorum TaxID=117978 RepID=A0ABD0UXB2_DENTH
MPMGRITVFGVNNGRMPMAAKKIDALEERLEGEMSQIKTTVEDRISSMEDKFSDLQEMVKKAAERDANPARAYKSNLEKGASESPANKEVKNKEKRRVAWLVNKRKIKGNLRVV